MTKYRINLLFWSLSFFMFSCSSNKVGTGSVSTEFSRTANYGTTGLLSEKGIAGFYMAIDAGVNAVQFNVVQSKDKQLIVSGASFKTTDIIKFPDLVDSVNKHFMTLKRPPLNYIVVLKEEQFNAQIADAVMKVVNEKGLQASIVIASLDIKTLRYVHQKYPATKTALIAEANSKSSFRKQIKDLGFTPAIYEAESSLVTDALVKDCQSKNIALYAWIVDDKDEVKKLQRMGVTGIVGNLPE